MASMEGTYEYPHQKWEDYAPAPKATADLRELSRNYLLSVHGANASVPTDDIAQAIAEKYSDLTYGKGERWEKSLKERLRTYYCFSGHTQKGSRVIKYACDPTVDPSLKRVAQKRKQGSSSMTPGPSTCTQSPAQEPDSPAPARPKKRKKKSEKPLAALVLSLPTQAIEPLPVANKPEQATTSQPDGENAAMKDGQTAEMDTSINKKEARTPVIRQELVHTSVTDEVPQAQPTVNGFSFDTSAVFEHKDNNYEGNMFYGMQCGPYVIKRRRRDSQFPPAPLLKLIRLAFGLIMKGEAAQKLVDQEEEDDLASMLLSKPTVSFASLADVRIVAEECNLLRFLSPLLADDLPELPEDHPISRPVPAGVFAKDLICRYCEHACISKSELRRHQIINAGTCQLERPRHLPIYQALLEADIEMMQKRQQSKADIASSHEPDPVHSPELQLMFKDEEDLEKATSCTGSSMQPSLLYWSAAEKERFFYALERYSRFRPDMIAEHVRTKTIGEVAAYFDVLEDGLSLLDSADTDISALPAAREMSQNWVKNEETLSSDVALWEIFTAQASAIPWEKRDFAQLAATQKPGRAHCEQCPRGACDAAWPICGRCTQRRQPCHWIRDFHPQALPEHMIQIKAALTPLGERSPPSATTDTETLHDSMMQSLSWHQLLVLSYQQAEQPDFPVDPEHAWSEEGLRSGKTAKGGKDITRKATSVILQEADLSSLSGDRKERIYKAVKHDLRQGKINEAPTATDLQRYNRKENVKTRPSDRKFGIKKALRWQDLPISNSSDTHWHKKEEVAGIEDEIHLAARQLRLTRMKVETLGPGADLFDLRKLALLIDLHRLGSDDDGCISKAAVEVLYDLLRCYVSKVVAMAVNLLEARHGSEEWSSKLKRKCVEEAIAQYKLTTSTSKEDDTVNLHDPFAPPCIHWYSASTFSTFGDDLDILPSSEFGDMAEDCDNDSDDSASEEDVDNAEEAEELEMEKKVDEKDQLEDHLYEERLWMLFKARDKRDHNDEEEDEEDEEDRRERMNLEVNDDEEEEDDRRRSEVETTDIGEETEDGLLTNDEDDEEAVKRRFDDDESDQELTRTVDEDDGARNGRPTKPKKSKEGKKSTTDKSAKQVFKSREFISTSDEEEL